jgi:tubulin beta
MGTNFVDVVCGEQGVGGDGEYCGCNDAQLGRVNVFYDKASGGKYVPRAALFDLEPGVINAFYVSPRDELFRPGDLVNQNAAAVSNWDKAHTQKLGTNSAESPRRTTLNT